MIAEQDFKLASLEDAMRELAEQDTELAALKDQLVKESSISGKTIAALQ